MPNENEVVDLLLAWRADVDSVPPPSLIMLEVACVLMCAAWPN
ncbi:hypothetical protein [Actinokineospora sp. HUAS TT18]